MCTFSSVVNADELLGNQTLTENSYRSMANATINNSSSNGAGTYLISQKMVNGALMDERISGPGLPPVGWNNQSTVNEASSAVSATSMSTPAMTWSYGCSPTSATMLFGYYDRTGYSNIYTGPTNGGVFPLTNAVWESSTGVGQCPLTASQKGLDGRTTRGHKDDYWYSYGSTVDPYYGHWTAHSDDSIADFMRTNRYQTYGNTDGSTRFWYWNNNAPLIPTSDDDGIYGMKSFAESRGYSVDTYYNQYIYGFNGNSAGFTFSQYKAEIDAGHPVLLQLAGHTVLGVGYSGSSTCYIHNTWDYGTYTMTWGDKYSNMQHYGVGVIHLKSLNSIKSNINVYRSGTWILGTTSGGTYNRFSYGTSADIPIIGDWDGDGVPTAGVYRGGTWILSTTSGGTYKRLSFGTSTDKPVAGDWDGDGKTNVGVYRNGQWILATTSGGTYKRLSFGTSTDKPVTGDWDGGGKTNIGVYRGGTWILGTASGGTYKRLSFGASTDIPVTIST